MSPVTITMPPPSNGSFYFSGSVTRTPRVNTGTAKKYRLVLTRRPNYLCASVSGDMLDGAVVLGYHAEIIAHCRRHGYSRVLIERDLPGVLSSGESFFVSRQLVQMGIGALKIAFVAREEDLERLEFSSTVANNRGANTRAFLNYSEALHWLLVP